MTRRTCFLSVALLSLLACAPATQRPPARVVPRVPYVPPPPQWGFGRAVIDVVDERALVSVVVGGPARPHPARPLAGALLRPLCISPCAVLLPSGRHRLAFARPDRLTAPVDTGLLDLDDRTTVYRRQLARPARWAGPWTIGGLLIAVAGTLGAAYGALDLLISFCSSDHPCDGPEDESDAYELLGISGLVFAGGVVAMVVGGDPGADGADVQWSIGGPNAPR